jgi:hyperosmotically inducible protein
MAVGVRTDDDIKKDIIGQLSWDARIEASDIEVAIGEGQVILSGTVPTYRARRTVEEDIRAIPGVQAIRNSLAVKHPHAAELPTDQELKMRIQSIFRWQPDIEPLSIEVSVQGGWVTLRGRVDAHWKKPRAERLICNVSGIVGVDNQIVVSPGAERGDDEEIEQQVRAALERNIQIEADQIAIRVHEGVVTVTGVAPTLSARRQVQEVIENMEAGIVGIENDVTLE